jgi:hypothetical protein
MIRLRLSTALAAAIISGLALAPPSMVAGQHGNGIHDAGAAARGALRGGLSALATGQELPDTGIASRLQGGTEEIAVSVDLGGAPDDAIREQLRSAGLTTRGSWQTTVEGYIAPSRLPELAAVVGVRYVTPIRRAQTSAFTSPAPALQGAATWQGAGFSGAGIKIGILDSGFVGFAERMGTELPASVQALCYPQLGVASANLADCVTPGVTHATAVAESIIDMAPAAQLYVSNAFSRADIAAAISWMTSAGVRVINFSQAWGLEGMGDGTSIYPNATYGLVDQAVAGGALFVASAGNFGATSWMGPPTDADGNGWLDFAPGVEVDSIDLRAGDRIIVEARWGSPASDYDLSIWQGNQELAQSADLQVLTGDPLEAIDFTAPSTGTYQIGIWHAAGPSAPTMRLMVMSEVDTSLAYHTAVGSLPAPADSRNAGMLTVGAVNYATPSIVEPYSSVGPTSDGRTKPDLVAADCAPTTIESIFCGTSEAAPFVSGAAALVLEANPTMTPTQLANYLRSHAAAIGSPIPNNATGSGLLALGPLPFTIPAALTFLAPAASGTAGAAFLGQPVVGIVDASGQLVTGGPGAALPITLSLAANPGGGTLSCPAGLTAVAVGGMAKFGGCTIDAAGSGYTLHATATGLPGLDGSPFTVAAAGSPPTLSLSALPTAINYGGSAGLAALAVLPAGANLAIDMVSGTGGVYGPPAANTTDANGLASWSANPTISTDYRVTTTDPVTGLVEVSAPVRVTVNATAVLAASVASGRTIYRTTKIALTESIRPPGAPAARGRARFDLYQRTAAGWVRRRIVYANADAAGHARLTLAISSIGYWWVRSRAEATATNGASAWTSGVRYTVR